MSEIRNKLIALMDEIDSIKENLDDADTSSLSRDLSSLSRDLESVEETVESAQSDLRDLHDKLDNILTEMDFSKPAVAVAPKVYSSEMVELSNLVHVDRNRHEILASYMRTNPAKFWLAVAYNLATNPYSNGELVRFLQESERYID
jgi:chromosome segregation ATPase